jgi:hypothetical protein
MTTSQEEEIDVVDIGLERRLRDDGLRLGVGSQPGSVAGHMCTV